MKGDVAISKTWTSSTEVEAKKGKIDILFTNAGLVEVVPTIVGDT
jgi:NADP-dependent 3-hydroxy acid dehydrogenase YdfG